MAGISPGLDARAASGLWETVRWTFAASSPSWRSTILKDGRCWNGNAVSRAATKAPKRAPRSLRVISSRLLNAHSTILQNRALMPRPTAECSVFELVQEFERKTKDDR